jgi:transposase
MPATLVKNCSESLGMLCVAFDLGLNQWSLAFTTGLMQRPREVQILAGDTPRLIREIAIAKRRFGLPEDAIVVSCYEAGREAFWLHRWLEAQQVRNHVVDSSSIEVNRRQRRGKTDRMDAKKLVKLLVRFCLGEQTVFSVVSVPSIAEEDDRHLHRELGTLTGDETALINRIKGLLAGFGLRLEPNSQFPKQLKKLQQWNGELLPPGVRQRLLCDFAVLQAVRKQIRELERMQKAQIRQDEGPATQQVRKLLGLRAVGPRISTVYVKEFFAWRQFTNRRQVGSLAGLCSTPFRSGTMRHERGISKAGNRWVRGLSVELAWSWLRWQPDSALSRWYARRFQHGGSRLRRIGIVALARKLLVALWKYLETGTPPEGAVLTDWKLKLRGRKSALASA